MKIITYSFLDRITNSCGQIHCSDIYESDEIKEIDNCLKKESRNHLNKFLNELNFDEILKKPGSDEEFNVIMGLIVTHFYFLKSSENKNKIRNQLKQCELFLNSDMCMRNNLLKTQIQTEILILKKALETNMISLFIKILNDLYSGLFPQMILKERCVLISETMHHLSLHSRERFFTREEAQGYLKKKRNLFAEDAATYIFDRIKKHLN